MTDQTRANRRMKQRAAMTVTMVGGTLFVNGQPAAAATFDVTNTNASGPGSLAQAVGDANDAAGPDTITFSGSGAAGTIDLGTATLEVTDDLTIVGPGEAALTLTNTGGNILYLYNEADLTMSGLTLFESYRSSIAAVDAGNVSLSSLTIDQAGDDDDSGAVSLYAVGSVSISNVTITDTYDAGVEIIGAADVTVANTTIDQTDGYADGIDIRDVGAVTVTDSTITDMYGDGLAIHGASDVTITNVVVTNTDDDDGIDVGYASGAVSISNSTVSGADDSGITVHDSASVLITDSTASNNGDDGIDVDTVDTATITGTTTTNNVDNGIYIDNVDTATINGTTTATDNSSNGISIYRVGDATISGTTTATGNSSNGMYIDDVDTATINGTTTASNNNDSGILFDDVGIATISGTTTASDNTGSGISLYQTKTSATISGVTADGNNSTGVSAVGFAGPGDSVTVTDSTLTGNGVGIRAVGFLDSLNLTGGAINDSVTDGVYLSGVDDVSITDVDIDNSGTRGVQAYALDSLSISETTVSSSASEGIFATNVSATDIGSSTISNGSATAIELRDSNNVAIVNSTIADNDISDSALVLLYGSEATISHSTISDNSSTAVGGGTTVYAYNNSSVTLDHTIATNNIGTVGSTVLDFFASGDSRLSAEHSIVPVGEIAAESLSATNTEVTDPLLGALGDNDGPTETMFPESGSPANDGGDPAISGEPTTDQRGGARVAGTIDIGAVEVDPGTVSIDPTPISLAEDGSSVSVVVERSGIGDGAVSVDVDTVDGTAVGGSDFTAVDETLSWADGDTLPKTVTVPVIDDTDEESDETFSVALTGAVSATINPTASTQAITIQANDTPVVVPPPPEPAPTVGPALTSLAPQRFVDTRPTGETVDNQFEQAGKRTADSEYKIQIAGRGNVPADAVGVIMNVTAIAPEINGFVTAHPCVSPRPTASSLNYTAGVNLGNEIISGLSTSGEVCIYTSGTAHISVDVVGYIAADSPTKPITPARLADTRPDQNTADGTNVPTGQAAAESETKIKLGGRVGIPTDAAAVIINVTAINPTETGFVTVHPCVDPRPTASSLNYVAGVNRGNEIVATLDDNGDICLFTSGAINYTVDAVGYIPAGTNLNEITPARFLDTRPGQSTIDSQNAGDGKRSADTSLTLPIAGRNGIPATAKAVIVNVTAIAPESTGFVTVSPCVEPRPTASSLNYTAGVNGGNEIVAQLSDDGELCLYTSGAAHLSVDVVGYLA